MAKISKVKTPVYTCKFCDREFKREETVNTHKCVKRDRYNERDSRQMRESFRIYMQFMEINKFPYKKGVEPFMSFIKSKYFNDFYNFGEYYLENKDILHIDDFTKHLIRNAIPIQEWSTYKQKEQWILTCIKNELPFDAVSRSISALLEWEQMTNNEWTTFFDNVSSVRFIAWIESGKISPWLLWLVPKDSSNKLFSRLSNSELEYILKYIDPSFFEIKTIKYKDDVTEIRKLLIQAGL